MEDHKNTWEQFNGAKEDFTNVMTIPQILVLGKVMPLMIGLTIQEAKQVLAVAMFNLQSQVIHQIDVELPNI